MKKKKYLIVVAVSILLTMAVASAENNYVYFVPQNGCNPECSGTVTVDVWMHIENETGCASGQMEIKYDPSVIEVTNWELYDQLQGGPWLPDDWGFGFWYSNTPGEEWISFLAPDQQPPKGVTGEVKIGTLTIECKGCNLQTDLHFDVTDEDNDGRVSLLFYPPSGYELPATWQDGSFTCGQVGAEPKLTSCDSNGNPKDYFAPGECVYVKGENLETNTDYKIWIQPEPVEEGETLDSSNDPSGSQETVTTDANGNFGPTAIWCIPADANVTYQQWDIVADKQNDGANTGVYYSDSDAIDDATTFGIVAPIPELPTLALAGLGLFGVIVSRRML